MALNVDSRLLFYSFKIWFWNHWLSSPKASCTEGFLQVWGHFRAMAMNAKWGESMAKNRKGRKTSIHERPGRTVEGIRRNLRRRWGLYGDCSLWAAFVSAALLSSSSISQKAGPGKEARGKTFFAVFLLIPASCTSPPSTTLAAKTCLTIKCCLQVITTC